jgi:putative component of membrane protein insertase Oxa1/YidC/SpoIIIJ protein YidD
MKWAWLLFFIPLLTLVFFPAETVAGETAFDVLVDKTEQEESAVDEVLRFYQENISSHDGPRCLFYPTCSQFAGQAVKEHGLFIGVLMTIDRMVYREDPLSLQYYIYDEEKDRYHDPVHHSNIFNETDYLK